MARSRCKHFVLHRCLPFGLKLGLILYILMPTGKVFGEDEAATFVQVQPRYQENLKSFNFIDGETYEIICLVRLGTDSTKLGNVGLFKPETFARADDHSWQAINWTASYQYGRSVPIRETGDKPDGFTVKHLISGVSRHWGGHHMNISIVFDAAVRDFQNTRILCGGDAGHDPVLSNPIKTQLSEFLQVYPRYQENPILNLTKGEKYVITCVAKVTQENCVAGTVGVREPEPGPGDVRDDSPLDWTATYRYGCYDAFTEQGQRPEGIFTTKVRLGTAVSWGGRHINISLSFEPVMGRLDRTQLLCSGDANHKRVWSNPLKLTFLPSNPKLEVFWPAKVGEIYAGDALRARCSAYVGDIIRSRGVSWFLNTADKAYAWKQHYGVPYVRDLAEWVTIVQWPAVKECDSGTGVSWAPTGTCYYLQNHTLSWQDAADFCEKHFRMTLVQRIDDSEIFELLRRDYANIDEDGYWIGLNDRRRKGQYVWQDGTKANVSEWGHWSDPTASNSQWRGAPYKLRCVMLHGGGLQKVDCNRPLPFMCQSKEGHVQRPSDIHPGNGLFVTSDLTIKARAFQEGARFHCTSYTNRTEELRNMITLGQGHSESSAPLRIIYGQLVPSITFAEHLIDKELSININCSAYVGNNGTMTLTLEQQSGTLQRWIIGREEQHVVASNTSGDVSVHVAEDTRNKDVGRHIVAAMLISLTNAFHLSTFSCYPYDITDEIVEIVSYKDKSELVSYHLIELKHLSMVSPEDVEDALNGKDNKLASIWKSTSFLLVKYSLWFIGLAALAMIIVLSVLSGKKRKQTERGTNAKERPPNNPRPIEETENTLVRVGRDDKM